MRRKIIHDYFDSFRPSKLRKIFRKENGFLFWFWITYYIVVLPKNNMFRVSLAYLLFAVFILNGYAVAIHLPKQMYLVPMTKEERTVYLRGLLCMKLSVPMLVGFLAVLVWAVYFDAPFVFAVMNYIGICSLAITISITSRPGSVWYRLDDEQADKVKPRIRDGKWKYLEICSCIGMVFSMAEVAVGMAFIEENDFTVLWISIVLGTLTVLLLLLDVVILRYTRPVVELASDYERMYAADRIITEVAQ